MSTPTQCVSDAGRISELAAQVARKECSARELVDAFLERIEEVETSVQAWREVDAAGARAAADQLDEALARGESRGALHGVPVAVKDVIDVAGLPTRAGSAVRAGAPPASADAEVVAAFRTAGAVILGKTHTTEFAFFDPSPARNPHNLAHTPGGSSSGSAAAVAAGMAPGALGTQTVASVNRPAGYCGIAAFKPSTGSLSSYGVVPLAPMYDTVGFFGGKVVDAVHLYHAVRPSYLSSAAGGAGRPSRQSSGQSVSDPLTVVTLDDSLLDAASEDVADALRSSVQRLADAGHRVVERRLGVSLDSVRERQWLTFLYEASRVHRSLASNPDVGEKLREAIERGAGIVEGDYVRMRASLEADRAAVFRSVEDADAVIWPAAPATAPSGLASTGDPRFIAPWTALGGPVVTAPAGFGRDGLPIGMLLVGAPGTDVQFGQVAIRLAATLDA